MKQDIHAAASMPPQRRPDFAVSDLPFSGPIQKKSSMSEESSSDAMEQEEALVVDPNVEQNLQRLRDEEKILLEQQAAMEAGNCNDIAALEHQDLLRLNQLQQRELKKLAATRAARLARLAAAEGERDEEAGAALRREPPRRRPCTVRVNNLHAVAGAGADAIETDV